MWYRALALAVLAALSLAACADKETPTDPLLETLTLTIVGDAQRTGVAGEQLPDPVTVLVEKTVGNKTFPAIGVVVNFVVVHGGGSVFAGTGVTDTQGYASDYWTLGLWDFVGGQNTLEVRAVSGDGTKRVYGTFTAWGQCSSDPGVGFCLGEQFPLLLPGTFQMGDLTGSGNPDELPVHTVNLTRVFRMQKTEVTQRQWRAIMGTNPSYFSSCGDLCPVEGVSWNDIQTFLATLNARFPSGTFRLPTEAEWEYAARAGTTGDYAGTGVLDDMGWYSDNSGGSSHPVAQKQPNAWGLFDMHGNLYEWVADFYSPTYYAASPLNDPQGPGPNLDNTRVVRGGSWFAAASSARSPRRQFAPAGNRYQSVGFRLVWYP